MVLASTVNTVSIDKLAELVDKIMQAALPPSSVSVVTSPLQSEVEQLQSEVTSLKPCIVPAHTTVFSVDGRIT